MGAGTSAYAGAPLMSNLMSTAYKNGFIGNRLKHFLRSFYKRRLDENHLPNIEELLSILDLAAQRKDTLIDKSKKISQPYRIIEPGLIDALKFEIDYLIAGTLHHTLSGNPLREYMREFINKITSRTNSEVGFISLNYDIILDNALQRAILHNPTEHTLTLLVDYGTKIKWAKYTDTICEVKLSPDAIKLIKPHGSLNLLQCPVCGELLITLQEKGGFSIFSKDIKCPEDRTPLFGFIVPPTWFKQFDNAHLINMWNEIDHMVSNCKKLIFLGYSLPDADIYFKYMIKRALMKNKNKVIIEVYTGNSNNEEKRYLSTFGNISFCNKHFEKYVEELN